MSHFITNRYDRIPVRLDSSPMTDRILIAGASVRAAAQTAVRFGLRPLAVDLFADEDLRAVAETRQSVDYPGDLPRLCRELPPSPWMYTGALENYPDVIAEISETRPLIGNSPEVLTGIRDPFRLESLLRSGGFPTAGCVLSGTVPDDGTKWLLKPVGSGCGFGIRSASPGEPVPRQFFGQECVAGIPLSAVYCASEDDCTFVGASLQLIGMASQAVSPFQFCGAVANFPVSEDVRAAMRETGEFVARETGLRGLFGIDFVQGAGGPVAIEVNPRYTATVELFERIAGRSADCQSFLRIERTATGLSFGVRDCGNCDGRAAGKVILYARDSGTAPEFGVSLGGARFPEIADIPRCGARIESGQPVCTVLADAANADVLLGRLHTTTGWIAEKFPAAKFDVAAIIDDLRMRLAGKSS